jgi:hypothetical protein
MCCPLAPAEVEAMSKAVEAALAAAAGPNDAEGWRRWLRIRDDCPIGQEYRYSEQQV